MKNKKKLYKKVINIIKNITMLLLAYYGIYTVFSETLRIIISK